MMQHSPPKRQRDPARVWLDVPYSQKDQAKALGARWDAQARRWYDPAGHTSGLQRWAALPELPEVLPGEDRGFGVGLFVDLVPASCWFTNVRSCVSHQDWERLRRMITRRAKHRCEACGRGEDRENRRWLEAHERWAYDSTAGVQTLRRLICLCTDCHQSTHFGHAQIKGRADAAFAHPRAVTGMSAQDADRHISQAFALWRARSAREWELDLSILTNARVTLAPPPPDRIAAAGESLRQARRDDLA